jgi:hypothetical protein
VIRSLTCFAFAEAEYTNFEVAIMTETAMVKGGWRKYYFADWSTDLRVAVIAPE